MTTEQSPSFREATGEGHVNDKADEDAGAACSREENLLAAMAICLPLAGVCLPKDGAHACRGNGLNDRVVGYVSSGMSHGHAAIQHIKGESLRSANDGANFSLQYRDFFSTVHAPYLEGAAVAKRNCRSIDLVWPATRRFAMGVLGRDIVGMRM
jgi:hypothetical protein